MINAGVEMMMQMALLILRRQHVEPWMIDNGPTRTVEESEDDQDDDFGGLRQPEMGWSGAEVSKSDGVLDEVNYAGGHCCFLLF
jgi:hypothetical protein